MRKPISHQLKCITSPFYFASFPSLTHISCYSTALLCESKPLNILCEKAALLSEHEAVPGNLCFCNLHSKSDHYVVHI